MTKLVEWYYTHVIKWFIVDWYKYIFEKKNLSFRSVICRVRGHPCGVWYYTSSNKLEPDMTCRNCGDDLG